MTQIILNSQKLGPNASHIETLNLLRIQDLVELMTFKVSGIHGPEELLGDLGIKHVPWKAGRAEFCFAVFE